MDTHSKSVRSANMASVKGKNTKPEIIIRQLLHQRGLRFRLHRKELPGNPDIVLSKYATVIFVNGCFWHGHHCSRAKRPTSNAEFWNAKLDRNIERDKTNYKQLRDAGWKVKICWECEIRRSPHDVIEKILESISFEKI